MFRSASEAVQAVSMNLLHVGVIGPFAVTRAGHAMPHRQQRRCRYLANSSSPYVISVFPYRSKRLYAVTAATTVRFWLSRGSCADGCARQSASCGPRRSVVCVGAVLATPCTLSAISGQELLFSTPD
ncbi:unnamed protein product [Parajaminaea phylloscopi]